MENGFDVKQAFYKSEDSGEESCGSILCFKPSCEAAQYILEQESDLNKLFEPAKPYRVGSIRLLNPVLTSFSDAQLLNLILQYGAKMEETDTFWHSVCSLLRSFEMPQSLSFYLLIRYGCKTRKCFQILKNDFSNDFYSMQYRFNYIPCVIFGMFILLTPNIEIDDMIWDKEEFEQFGTDLLTTEMSQQITGGSSDS